MMKKLIAKESSTKCRKCGATVSMVNKYLTDDGHFDYEIENLDNRFVDKWGHHRNFCKGCIK